MRAADLRPLTRHVTGNDLARVIETYIQTLPDVILQPVTMQTAAELMGQSDNAFSTARSEGRAPGGARPLGGRLYYPSAHHLLISGARTRDDAWRALIDAYPFHGMTHRDLLERQLRRYGSFFDEPLPALARANLFSRTTEALAKAGVPAFATRREALLFCADILDPQPVATAA